MLKKTSQTGHRKSVRSRATSPQAKADVRAAFITAGRRLLAHKGSKEYSLRAVAAAAGYSPGAIYQYFSDHRALLLAIREQDMLEAAVEFERMAAAQDDPETRVKEVFLGAACYWLAHFEHFEALFSLAPSTQIVRNSEGVPFGRSAVVVRSYAVFDQVVRAFLREQPTSGIEPKVAVDCLIAAVHGMIWFPHATRTMNWTKTEPMISIMIDAMLTSWKLKGDRPKTRK